MKHLVLLLLGLLGHALPGRGQAAAPLPEAWQAIFFEAPAVALPLLAAAAVQHSAALEAVKTDKDITHEDLQMARKAILSSILLSNNFGYGNIASVTVADQRLLPNAGTTSSQTHYSTAINLNLPLDRLLNRRNQINRQQLQYQKLEHLRQAQEDRLRQSIIDLYQTVLLNYNTLSMS
ncbi:TolC family protein [Hymenobacter terricola]|uniref:TolC family protein n=1 Tax=Hymenobacter terricola TaxID=2819236 RepID=UPI001B31562C|nr:TolC family protein [Hymenobacter terricola]